MKVLDPQSALLTNAEVYQFLQAHPARKPEKQIGSYSTTNLVGYTTILKDFDTYTEEVTPYTSKHAPVNTWISNVIKRLRPYELTKSEVMNLINMGIGTRGPAQQAHDEADGEEEEQEQPDDEAEIARDIQFFKVAVEEADERFAGEDGDERIREVVLIMKESIDDKEERSHGVKTNGTHKNG